MDIFVEYMVKRKKTAGQITLEVLAIIAGFFFLVFGIFIINMIFPVMQLFTGVLAVGTIYGVYRLITSHNVEYEYAITNGEMDVDMIISKRRRKRLATFSCRTLEILAPLSGDKYTEEYKNLKTIFAAQSKKSPTAYFAVFNRGGGRECLLFEPSRKMLDTFSAYAKSRVFTNEN